MVMMMMMAIMAMMVMVMLMMMMMVMLMVPVMLMGYLVSQRTYKPFEYLVAVAVTAGAMIFKLYETNDAPVQNTEFIGIVLIVAYMGCDSFTSNWQSKIFTQ